MLQRRRSEDASTLVWVLEKIGAPVVVACSLSILGAVVTQFLQVRALTDEVAKMNSDIVIIKSQMVGWDTLRRIEMYMEMAATRGSGGEAMRAVSKAIRAEVEAKQSTKGAHQ